MVVVEAFEFIPSISCYRIIYRISHPFILDILTSLFLLGIFMYYDFLAPIISVSL